MAFLFRSIDKQGIAKTYEEFEKRQGKGFKRPPADVRGPFWLSENGVSVRALRGIRAVLPQLFLLECTTTDSHITLTPTPLCSPSH